MPVVTTSGSIVGNSAMVAYNNYAAGSVISATSAAVGYPAINTVDPATWSSWRPTAAPSNISYDLTTEQAVDVVCIGAHNLATTASTVRIERSSDGVSWTAARPPYLPTTDDDIIFTIPSQTYRYWRIRITGGIPNIGIVFLSSRLNFPHTPIDSYTPLHHAKQYTKEFNDSIKGALLGNRVMAAGSETDVDLGFVERTFVDGPLRAFESHYNQGNTFFYAGWPAGQPLDMGYCRALGEDEIIAVEYIEADKLANLRFGVRAYVG